MNCSFILTSSLLILSWVENCNAGSFFLLSFDEYWKIFLTCSDDDDVESI